ncbi:MAG: dnaA, partial [Conexibacter sp.]|nr:dnaA [Conexibacter sp.]
MPDPAPIWTRLQAELRHRVSESAYDIWLAPLRWGGIDGERIVVLAPAEVRAWVQQRFVGVLEEAARVVLGEGSAATVE